MDYDTDFPEYGKQATLTPALRGYETCTIIGMNGYKFVVEVSSGATLEVYRDEIEIN